MEVGSIMRQLQQLGEGRRGKKKILKASTSSNWGSSKDSVEESIIISLSTFARKLDS